jgi:hypothetical protein
MRETTTLSATSQAIIAIATHSGFYVIVAIAAFVVTAFSTKECNF